MSLTAMIQQVASKVITTGTTASLTCVFENPALYQSSYPSQALSVQWKKGKLF